MGHKIMTKLILYTILLFTVSGIIWYLYFRRKENHLLGRLQKMVDDAASGDITCTEISESKLSALENDLKRLLNDNFLTAKNQSRQKSIIQELISDIAHQTLTPVTNLKLYSELLMEDIPASDSQAYRSELAVLHDETEKLDFLIQSLVQLSRMESGLIAVSPKETPLCTLMTDIRSDHFARAAEKNMFLDIRDTSLTAYFDPKWTREAVGNIVDNAIKYSSPGSTVTISSLSYSFFVRIDITDAGIGIAEEELARIFSRFYRSPDVSELPGVGIGLYLAREIIHAQKGYIKVTSQKGSGSVFSVFLPRRQISQNCDISETVPK